MNYEQAVKIVKRSAIAVSSAYLALIALDASVMASSLPYVYVTDHAANCGARFLVKFTSHCILRSGLLTIVALAVAQLYSGWISGRKLTFTIVGDFGKATLSAVTLVFGLLSIIFFLSPANQLLILGNPPYLTDHFTTGTPCPNFPDAS